MRVQDNFEITKLIDLTPYENENKFLEGTGSIVFDYSGKTVHHHLIATFVSYYC